MIQQNTSRRVSSQMLIAVDKTDYENLERLNEPFNYKKEFLSLMFKIVYQGVLGAVIFLLLFGSLLIMVNFFYNEKR